jgi:Protein of unknown function (DUF1264)
MNQNIVDQLAERIINETNSAVSCLTLYLGHKLDLFNSLEKDGPTASEELSKKTKYSERYIREWLECMMANGYIDYDPLTKRFSISEEQELFNLIVHHHCKLYDDMNAACLLFPTGMNDQDKPYGIEYVIPADQYNTLPEEEKRYWHYHLTELRKVKATLLT